MRGYRAAIALCVVGLFAVRGAQTEEEKGWKQFIESGVEHAKAAEAAKNSGDRRYNVEQAASQFQVAVRMGRDKSEWRPLVFAAEGYIRLIAVASGNDRDNYRDLAGSALDSAATLAKSKSDRDGTRAVVRAYNRLAQTCGGEKQKTIEAKIRSLDGEAGGLPSSRRNR